MSEETFQSICKQIKETKNGWYEEYGLSIGKSYVAHYVNGILHRVDGPTIIWQDGQKEWYQNGKLHRINGPAIIEPDGKQWHYLDGQLLV